MKLCTLFCFVVKKLCCFLELFHHCISFSGVSSVLKIDSVTGNCESFSGMKAEMQNIFTVTRLILYHKHIIIEYNNNSCL